MLNIYPVILDFVSDIAALIPRIAHHDPDLARQLRRSSASVVLNACELGAALVAGTVARSTQWQTSYNEARRVTP